MQTLLFLWIFLCFYLTILPPRVLENSLPQLLSLWNTQLKPFWVTKIQPKLPAFLRRKSSAKPSSESGILIKMPLSLVIAELHSGAELQQAFANVFSFPPLRFDFTIQNLQLGFNQYLQSELTPSSQQQVHRISSAIFLTCQYSRTSGIPCEKMLLSIQGLLQSNIDAENQRLIAISGPKQTAKILGLLPLVGILLGFLLGVNPLNVLLDGGIGSVIALVGIGFYLLGNRWTRRLLTRAQELEG
jgi:Flp pilus assembly protein TadB